MFFDIVNPTTGEKLKSYAALSLAQVHDILDSVHDTQQRWKQVAISERVPAMLRLSQLLREKKDEYARLMAVEMGKVLAQGVGEIEKCAWVCEFYAKNAEQFLAPEPVLTEAKKSFVNFCPLGTLLAIMPWNYPFWQVFRFAVPALMAGNGVVLKHAPNVFGTALAIESLFREAGFPPQLFRSLLIDVPHTTEVIHDPRIAAVTLTSSVEAGRAIATEAGRALKKCVLELGGSDPFIVLADADVDRAVEVGVMARFQNSGQSCIAAKRFILVPEVKEAFEKKFVERARSLRMGNPLDSKVDMGPMARFDLRDALHAQVERTLEGGAQLLLGGVIPDQPGAFYGPTVLSGVKSGMVAWHEELFGPVATMIAVAHEEEAIEVANATSFGLGASIWTRDLKRGERIAAERIDSGSCFVNAMTKSDPRLPFGGIKHSGYGRELSQFGIREFVNVHSVWIQES